MTKCILVVVDYDALISDCAILSELTEAEKKDYQTYILPQKIRKLLSKGKPHNYFQTSNGQSVDTLYEYLNSFLKQPCTDVKSLLLNAKGNETTPPYSSLQGIAKKVLRKIRALEVIQSTICPQWQKFLRCTYLQCETMEQQLASTECKRSCEIYCAISLNCPKDIEAHCLTSLKAAGINDWPVLSSSTIGFSKYDQQFWERGAEFIAQSLRRKETRHGLCCSYYSTFKCCKTKNCVRCSTIDRLTFDHVVYIDNDDFDDNAFTTENGSDCLADALYRQIYYSRLASSELETSINQSKLLFCGCCECCRTDLHCEDKISRATEPTQGSLLDKLAYVYDELRSTYAAGFSESLLLRRSCIFLQSWRKYIKCLSQVLDLTGVSIDDSKETSIRDALEFITVFVCSRVYIRAIQVTDSEDIRLGSAAYKFDIQGMVSGSKFNYMIFLNGYNAKWKQCRIKKRRGPIDPHDDLQIWNNTVVSNMNENHASSMCTESICTDGAFNTIGILPPSHVIGDFDSINTMHDQNVKERDLRDYPAFHYMPDQNNTDFEKSLLFTQMKTHNSVHAERNEVLNSFLRYCKSHRDGKAELVPRYLSLPQSSVLVLGAGGGRKDHEMAIYKSLLDNAHLHNVIVCKMEDNLVIPIAPGRKYSFSGIPQKTMCGVISMGVPTISVITSGFEWELNGLHLDFSACSGSTKYIVADSTEECEKNVTSFLQVNHLSDMGSKKSSHIAARPRSNNTLKQEKSAASAEAPTISTSNSISYSSQSLSTLKRLLLWSMKALEKKLCTEELSAASSNVDSDTIDIGAVEISSLHAPVLLLLEYYA
ncbi:thiamin pyrophosphokinase [Perkinsela sp. CCAP 1560/4]|nr:thiamin pyrophosphokinase [Perkinsela sp. CCAP 1560/4]|eukprot:KNH09545.1 thiamin pyrophosphokinase [Perkinsela sp. CCAP 1560/4]